MMRWHVVTSVDLSSDPCAMYALVLLILSLSPVDPHPPLGIVALHI